MFGDLTVPIAAYSVGLLQTDGSHSGSPDHKGKVQIELAERDEGVLVDIAEALPCYSSIRHRTRTTNFGQDYRTSILAFFDRETRRALVRAGVPSGRKSAIVAPPKAQFSRPDYMRGVLDGDGSVGFTRTGAPFVSLVTASPHLADFFCDVALEVCGVRRSANPNARDSVYNLMVKNVAAAKLASWAWYSDDVVSIPRKRTAARSVAEWTPPAHKAGRYGVPRKSWTKAEDEIVSTCPVEEAVQLLGRTEKSVKMRAWRLLAQKRS